MNLWQKIWAILEELVHALYDKPMQMYDKPMQTRVPPAVTPLDWTPPAEAEDINPITPTTLLWGNSAQVIHSMRVIGDTFNMTMLQKDMLCDICECEGGYKPDAKLVNNPHSIDRGLFQINNLYHPEATDALAYDSEWSTRWACKQILAEKAMNLWSASAHCLNKTHKYDALLG